MDQKNETIETMLNIRYTSPKHAEMNNIKNILVLLQNNNFKMFDVF